MIERFRKAKQAEIGRLLEMEKNKAMPVVFAGARPSFVASLSTTKPYAVIAEYKRASPSKGEINLKFQPEDIALVYASAGCGAISVLTEEDYFKGNLAYLERMMSVGLPLLRKDFILHPLQVDQTAATPASAMLLIVRMLDDSMLEHLVGRSLGYGIEPVVEVFDKSDLCRAQAVGAKVIQVNNRDLDTLKTDCRISQQLISHKRTGEFWITASGIDSHEQLVELLGFGFDAALVGSSLMQGENPGEQMKCLLGGELEDKGLSHV